jgi:2-keto-4-pentenoate hydratase/2-oxohepta-3-ene-1,7-dioic acid hydratase in catechol pathway
MKLLTFEHDGRRHIGALLADDGTISDFTASEPSASHFHDMLSLIDAGADASAEARDLVERPKVRLPCSAVRLLAPVPEPRQMRDFLCFEKHLRQARANRYLFGIGDKAIDPADVEVPAIWYEQPIYYKCNRFSVIGSDQDVRWPRYCKILDYELEFGIFLGAGGRNIRREDARKHVFGYCIFNDFSARDTQMREMQGQLGPAKGKDFDTGNVLGPWLVTADEIPDPYSLSMIARVNGEAWSRGNSAEMNHKFEDILVHASSEETLHPGEFFGSGTVGSGCGLELGRFLKPGDVVELEVEGLGVLRNRVISSP